MSGVENTRSMTSNHLYIRKNRQDEKKQGIIKNLSNIDVYLEDVEDETIENGTEK